MHRPRPRRFRLWMLLVAVALLALPLALAARRLRDRANPPPALYVVGDVARPGRYAMRGNLTVLDLIACAGGFRSTADRQVIQVVRAPRSFGQSPTVLDVDYDAITARGDLATNYRLRPDDRVFVFREAARPAAAPTNLNPSALGSRLP